MDESVAGVADGQGAPEGHVAAAPIDWAPIQLDYESGTETLNAIAGKYGITKGQLLWHARKHCWRPRNKRGGAGRGPSLLARMFRLLERLIFQLESETSPMGEKEAAALGRVAATLEKLMDIERTAVPPKVRKRTSKDLEELRKKVAARFEELAEQ